MYPHDDPRGFDVDHLPDDLKGKKYYRPTGAEAARLNRRESGTDPSRDAG